jgi:ATP-dependent helicase IRC3
MQLRDYQQRAVDAVHLAMEKGINKQVAVLATGLGKTVIFSHIISQRVKQTGKKALIIAHREELLLQAKDKLQRINPDLRIGIEQAEKVADHTHDDVIIASVATIGRMASPRLHAFLPEKFSSIIIDEAHHASALSYRTVLRYFGVLKEENDTNKNILLLGLTATPNRNDNKGIDHIFDEVVFNYPIVDGVKNGWLSSIAAVKVATDVSLQQVKTSAGDFVVGELEKAVNTKARNVLLVKTYQDIAGGKQALVFAVDVAHTKDLYESFIDAGITAGFITGETPKDERKNLLLLFAEKKIHVMINALVLTEGYDNAGIEFIFMARPTQSGLLYQQMIGRGTRRYHGKERLMIVDFVDNTTTHSLQTAASLLGLNGAVSFQGQDILSVQNSIERLLEKRPFYDLNSLDIRKIDYLLKEVDILQANSLTKKEENYTWHTFGNGMRMHNGKHRYFFVEQTLTGQYDLYEFLRLVHKKNKLGEFASQSEAMRYADKQIISAYSLNPMPVNTSEQRSYAMDDLPSEAQSILLRELGVDENTILFINKRDASRLISERKGRR